MNKSEKILEDVYEINDNILNKNHILKQVKSKYLKELLTDNIINSQLILKCIYLTLLHIVYLRSDYRKKELLINSLKEMKEDFIVYDEDLLKLLSQDTFYDNLEIVDDYITKQTEPLIIFYDGLIDIGLSVLKRQYSSMKENIKIISNRIVDYIPIISGSKQIVETIKDISICVDNLDKQQKYCEEINSIDTGISAIEEENDLLTKVLSFLCCFDFIYENLNKDINELRKYVQ